MLKNFIKRIDIKNCHGQSIVEVIIAMAIFSLIGAAMIVMVTGSFTALVQGGEHTQAESLAQEGIEAVRAVRDRDWDSLTCTNCVAEISGSEWVLSSGADETIGQYTRTITLSDVYRDSNNDIAESGTLDQYTKLAEVQINWTIREGITNSVERIVYFTNWWYAAVAATKVSYWDETNKDLKFATCDSNCTEADNWSLVTVDSLNDVGQYTSVEVDDSGGAHISYYYINDKNLKYAYCASDCDQAGNWSTATVDSSGDVGQHTSLAINSDGDTIRISYYDESDKNLKYAQCSSNCTQVGNWSTVTVDSSGDIGQYTAIVIDGDDNPRISYYDESDKNLKYAQCSSNCTSAANWSTVTVDSSGDVGMYSSIAIDINGYPRISYNREDTKDLKYAVCDSNCTQAGNWTKVALDTSSDVGEYTSLALETENDGPRISYMDNADKDLKYAYCDSSCTTEGSWSYLTVESSDDVGLYTSLGLADGTKPRVAFYEEGNKDLKYSSCDENCGQVGNWTTITLDSADDVGSYNSTNSGQREVGAP